MLYMHFKTIFLREILEIALNTFLLNIEKLMAQYSQLEPGGCLLFDEVDELVLLLLLLSAVWTCCFLYV